MTPKTNSPVDNFPKKRSKYMLKVKRWIGGDDRNEEQETCGPADNDKFRAPALYYSHKFLTGWFLIGIAVPSSNRGVVMVLCDGLTYVEMFRFARLSWVVNVFE